MATTDLASGAEQQTVAVLATRTDAATAELLRSGLAGRGTRLTADDRMSNAVVGLMSTRSLIDPKWRDAVERHVGSRLVPVKAEDIDQDQVPSSLREINWIQWQPDAPRTSIEQVFVALHTDLNRYRDAQSLNAQTAAWVTSGRDDDFLLDDIPRLREFGRRLRLSQDEGAATISAVAQQFLVASALLARRQRFKRARSFGWRLGLLVTAVFAVIGGVQAVASARQQYIAAVGFTAVSTGTHDVTAIKVSSLLLRAQKTHATFPAVELRVLAKDFGQHWDRAVVGVTADTPINGQVLAGPSVIGVDGLGRFDRWSLTKGVPMTTWQVSRKPLFYLDVSGSLALAADRTTVFVLDVSRRTVRRITSPAGIVGIALARTENAAIVRGADSVWRLPLSGGAPVRLAGGVDVLDIQRMDDGTARALVQDGGTLRLLSDAGTVIRSWNSAKSDADFGAISPDGRAIALVQNGRVITSEGASSLIDTGIVVGRARALASLRHGLVAVQTDGAGLQVFDAARALPLGQFCQRSPTVRAVSEAPDGTLLCQSAGFSDVDSLAHAAPNPVARAVTPALTAKSGGEIERLSIDATGLIHLLRRRAQGDRAGVFDPTASTLTPRGPTTVLDAPGLFANRSGATTVAIAPGGATAAVGFADGTVWEFDVDASGRLAPDSVWKAPDNSPVNTIIWDLRSSALRVTTPSGSWSAPSCAGCFAANTVLSRIRGRLLLCYAADDIATFDFDIRQRLALTACATPTVG